MKASDSRHFTTRMLIAMAAAILCGLGIIALRESLTATGQSSVWETIDGLLFKDISQAGNERALGLIYILGQIFVRALQLTIVPMVFTSIVLAMIRIQDSRRLGRVARKSLWLFLLTTVLSIAIACGVGMMAYNAGWFKNRAILSASSGSAGSNPLMVLVNAIPSNFIGSLSNNSGVLAVVVVAVTVGLAVNALGDKVSIIPKLCREISDILTVVLTWVVDRFAPVSIFCLLTRTFAVYGITYLEPALAYVLLTTALLLVVLFFGYPLLVRLSTGLRTKPFARKISKVMLLGFSTSSSAATLPMNMHVATQELGISEEIASFVLPLGMTVNMDGTAIMQTIATLFIAGCAGYPITLGTLILIGVLAIVASIGTPAAPGAGAVILFTILTGAGFNNEAALMSYALILAINRPIEMLVTALNVTGDTACAVIVAKKEHALNVEKYEANRT